MRKDICSDLISDDIAGSLAGIRTMSEHWPEGTHYVETANLPKAFFDNVDQGGDRKLLFEKRDGAWHGRSWREIADDVRRLAAVLVDCGVEPGERVLISAENRPEWARCRSCHHGHRCHRGSRLYDEHGRRPSLHHGSFRSERGHHLRWHACVAHRWRQTGRRLFATWVSWMTVSSRRRICALNCDIGARPLKARIPRRHR